MCVMLKTVKLHFTWMEIVYSSWTIFIWAVCRCNNLYSYCTVLHKISAAFFIVLWRRLSKVLQSLVWPLLLIC